MSEKCFHCGLEIDKERISFDEKRSAATVANQFTKY